MHVRLRTACFPTANGTIRHCRNTDTGELHALGMNQAADLGSCQQPLTIIDFKAR